MIRHFVLLRFLDSVDTETKASIYKDLRALRDHLPGIVGFHAGPNVSVETDLIRGNGDAFWVDFVDRAARDAYLADAGHGAVGARIVANTVGGVDGVTVVDIEF